ncbi:GAF domain-containing protein [Mesorhizobium sp. M1C.F.Ca.ET.193.01.1.1]|uniref:GAF domain-containing sensor histidine kinase n=1 Tax=unclassified Mesorhizobium TaxID=325217 RepID=UPI000FD55E7C|nr:MULTISPECIES: GAF domain-containing protein [unclassified Mesorhizobium]TGS92515.1 GAF domain-containing protein [bacterium M00.F.Ca.ET.177.01.1.1]RWA60039.1 MAG: GAF domain-containing protein [Mesorhizobium sp.]RWB93563.1 MAG: GAF domain-containing protein [Mesorhizobium sp.]RWG82258.1 MAG: GAF domain-containing protein [Mesorhizobium sp.]RWG86937.1 MAG: GAF domain-containing protein [Mesorhizobium sp.]
MSEVSPQLIDRLLAISRALAGHIDPGSAFRATAIEIGTLIPHDHIDLAVLSLDGRMHACYEAGFHTSWSDLAQHPVEGSPIRRVLRGETPYLLSDNALVDDRFHFEGAFDGPIFAAKLRSRIIVPLRARGSVIGALNISRHEAGCYTQEDVEAAQQCADLIGPYIFALIQTEEARRAMLAESEARNRAELLRVGASQLTEGMERERRRMAMDLHDQTLADLARIARQVSAFRSRGVARTAQLADLEQEVAGCLAELRHIVDDMRPSVLELFGLRDAVEAHLNRSVARAKPPIAVRIADTSDGSADSLSETLRTALYRIVQEAINNAVRHAGPSRIEVQLASTPGTFSVTVSDDGQGCGTVDPAAQGGIGHMHTRAALVGARLRFEPASRKGGTRVVIEIDREAAADKGSPRTVAPEGQSVAEAV